MAIQLVKFEISNYFDWANWEQLIFQERISNSLGKIMWTNSTLSRFLKFNSWLRLVKTRAKKGCARKWNAVDKMITVFHGSKNFKSLHTNYLRILKQSKSYWLASFISSKILKPSTQGPIYLSRKLNIFPLFFS